MKLDFKGKLLCTVYVSLMFWRGRKFEGIKIYCQGEDRLFYDKIREAIATLKGVDAGFLKFIQDNLYGMVFLHPENLKYTAVYKKNRIAVGSWWKEATSLFYAADLLWFSAMIKGGDDSFAREYAADFLRAVGSDEAISLIDHVKNSRRKLNGVP